MRRLTAGVLGMLFVLLAPAGARAQTQPAPDKDAAVILVVDASKSMRADDGSGQPKIAAAKSALNKAASCLAWRLAELPTEVVNG